ncbi:hypothetical protein P280DRAFT_513398 [Massarina eburnea CBS 473.64]|uniref:Uncharacterized protein n=1 Tax=Massarina eburnea CBS 473.64 TaxID=1395130 RepID=A0A6A6SCC3_9PLEO|nr:hypothetical protein P280DRAFT_513398 [Massarina eburnea CBS 473.64]
MKIPTPEELAYIMAHVDDTKQPGLIACSVTYLVAAIIGVLLRFITRHETKAKLRWSDYLILVAIYVFVVP